MCKDGKYRKVLKLDCYNKEGKTPMDLAFAKEKTKIIELLFNDDSMMQQNELDIRHYIMKMIELHIKNGMSQDDNDDIVTKLIKIAPSSIDGEKLLSLIFGSDNITNKQQLYLQHLLENNDKMASPVTNEMVWCKVSQKFDAKLWDLMFNKSKYSKFEFNSMTSDVHYWNILQVLSSNNKGYKNGAKQKCLEQLFKHPKIVNILSNRNDIICLLLGRIIRTEMTNCAEILIGECLKQKWMELKDFSTKNRDVSDKIAFKEHPFYNLLYQVVALKQNLVERMIGTKFFDANYAGYYASMNGLLLAATVTDKTQKGLGVGIFKLLLEQANLDINATDINGCDVVQTVAMLNQYNRKTSYQNILKNKLSKREYQKKWQINYKSKISATEYISKVVNACIGTSDARVTKLLREKDLKDGINEIGSIYKTTPLIACIKRRGDDKDERLKIFDLLFSEKHLNPFKFVNGKTVVYWCIEKKRMTCLKKFVNAIHGHDYTPPWMVESNTSTQNDKQRIGKFNVVP